MFGWCLLVGFLFALGMNFVERSRENYIKEDVIPSFAADMLAVGSFALALYIFVIQIL